jgi:hypothetical protein
MSAPFDTLPSRSLTIYWAGGHLLLKAGGLETDLSPPNNFVLMKLIFPETSSSPGPFTPNLSPYPSIPAIASLIVHPIFLKGSYFQQKCNIPYTSDPGFLPTLFPTFSHRSYSFLALGRGKRVPCPLL